MKKSLKIIGISLLIILISVIAFVGIYVKNGNVWKNIIPEFKYGMELDGVRELRYIVDTTSEEKNVYIDSEGNILGEVKETEEDTSGISLDTTVEETTVVPETEKVNYATEKRKIRKNEESNLTIENYEKTKKMIQDRIEKNENFEYNIRLDSVTGDLILEVPNNDDVVINIESMVETVGKFKVIDYQTGIILMDNSDVKNYSISATNTSGYQAYLIVNFTEEGAEKLKEISKEYIETTDEAGESSIKYVSVQIDDSTFSTTYFGEEMKNGTLQIPIGQATTDVSEYSEIIEELSRLVNVLNSGELPVVYALNTDNYIQSNITNNDINIYKIVFAVCVVAISIYFIIRYKAKGIIALISSIGYIATYVLIIKYTNVSVTINSVFAFVGMIIANYIFMANYLSRLNKNENPSEAFNSSMKKYYLNIIPVCVIAVIFTFVGNVIINTIGMTLFWGLILHALYNVIFTRTLYLSK